MTAGIAGEYGNVDVRGGAPAGYVHVAGRFSSTARACGIIYWPALTGFVRSGDRFRPQVSGIVLAAADWERVKIAWDKNSHSRASAAVRRKATLLERQAEADALGVRLDSRTFSSYRRGEIDAQEARRIGEITRHRHEATNYDALIQSGMDRDTARGLIE